MAVRIITADERRRTSALRSTVFIVGSFGVGKTSLLYTLDPDTTLALDFEAGMKSVATWRGDSIEIRSWQDAVDIACYLGGPDPAVQSNLAPAQQTENFSSGHYQYVTTLYGPGSPSPIDPSKYKTIFFDSISDLIAAKLKDAQSRNMVYSQKTKELVLDTRGMYGDIGRDGMGFIRHMQHAPQNIIWVGRLENITDEFKREIWQPQLDGQKVGREMPGVVDQVLTLAFFDHGAGGWSFNPTNGEHRVFVCQRRNPWGLPAKERTMGNVEMIEEPHLGRLLEKINQPLRQTTA